MKDKPLFPNRLRADASGLGEAAEADIEHRAQELAMIDGRDTYTDADLAQAQVELAGGIKEPVAPEAASLLVSDITAWDEPLDEHGHQSERVASLDEASVPEQLIQEGLSEADHEQRVAAAEEVADEEI